MRKNVKYNPSKITEALTNCLYTVHVYFKIILNNGDIIVEGTPSVILGWFTIFTNEHFSQF